MQVIAAYERSVPTDTFCFANKVHYHFTYCIYLSWFDPGDTLLRLFQILEMIFMGSKTGSSGCIFTDVQAQIPTVQATEGFKR